MDVLDFKVSSSVRTLVDLAGASVTKKKWFIPLVPGMFGAKAQDFESFVKLILIRAEEEEPVAAASVVVAEQSVALFAVVVVVAAAEVAAAAAVVERPCGWG